MRLPPAAVLWGLLAGPWAGLPDAAWAQSAAHRHADAPGIDWFAGEVGAAFDAAKRSGRPLLLYWGASWCPPCQQLKSTVFSRPDFIARSRLFVPVYLDGDDEGAQKWGEQFRVLGYPTVVVLDAERHELMRIAGGMDLEQYTTVLDTALAHLDPADALLAASAGGRALDLNQCRRLAFNSWELGPDADAAASARLAQQLDAAAALCPADAHLERARLRVFAAAYGAHAEADALKAQRPPSAALRNRLAAVGQVLAQERTAVKVSDALQSLDEDAFRAVKTAGFSASRWLRNYDATMDAAAADPGFAEADRLGAIGSKLTALKTIKGAIPSGAARAARARVTAVLAEDQAPYVRSGIINAVLPIFDLLGLNEQAYAVVQAELRRTATPYYYKADLGELAEHLGRKDEALRWYAEAYAEALGPATRFQWGRMYATSLLRLSPEDVARISVVTTQVLGELAGPDRIYRRDRINLVRLDQALRKWNSDAGSAHRDVLVALRERLQQICVKIPAAEPARGSCDAFLSGV
jgi:thioredoxin-like negative regulator of GroEL